MYEVWHKYDIILLPPAMSYIPDTTVHRRIRRPDVVEYALAKGLLNYTSSSTLTNECMDAMVTIDTTTLEKRGTQSTLITSTTRIGH